MIGYERLTELAHAIAGSLLSSKSPKSDLRVIAFDRVCDELHVVRFGLSERAVLNADHHYSGSQQQFPRHTNLHSSNSHQREPGWISSGKNRDRHVAVLQASIA